MKPLSNINNNEKSVLSWINNLNNKYDKSLRNIEGEKTRLIRARNTFASFEFKNLTVTIRDYPMNVFSCSVFKG